MNKLLEDLKEYIHELRHPEEYDPYWYSNPQYDPDGIADRLEQILNENHSSKKKTVHKQSDKTKGG